MSSATLEMHRMLVRVNENRTENWAQNSNLDAQLSTRIDIRVWRWQCHLFAEFVGNP